MMVFYNINIFNIIQLAPTSLAIHLFLNQILPIPYHNIIFI